MRHRRWTLGQATLIAVGALVLVAEPWRASSATAQGPGPAAAKVSTVPVMTDQQVKSLASLAVNVAAQRKNRENLVRDWNSWVSAQTKAAGIGSVDVGRYHQNAASAAALADFVYQLGRPTMARAAHDTLSEGYFKLAQGLDRLAVYAETGDHKERLEGNRLLAESAILIPRGEEALQEILGNAGVSATDVGF